MCASWIERWCKADGAGSVNDVLAGIDVDDAIDAAVIRRVRRVLTFNQLPSSLLKLSLQDSDPDPFNRVAVLVGHTPFDGAQTGERDVDAIARFAGDQLD